MTIEAPKFFNATSLPVFLNACQVIFEKANKREKDFLLDLSKIKKTSMIGVLVVYKLIEYTFVNKCFDRPMLLLEKPIQEAWTKYGFTELIMTYMSRGDVEDELRSLKIVVEDNFFIAPQALLRKDNYSSNSLKNIFLPKIEQYYGENSRAVSMIFTCLSEILLNFWEHAVEDGKSIIVANGSNSNIEIACADNGSGIVTSLGSSLKEKSLSAEQIVKKSVEKGITSKAMTNHMGYGLWIIDEIVKATKGRMHLYSEGAFYQNEMGTIATGKCGYWQGTIIYVSLPLRAPKTLADIEPYQLNHDLKINWG